MNLESMEVYNQVFVFDIPEGNWRRNRVTSTPRFTPGATLMTSNGKPHLITFGGCNMLTRQTMSSPEAVDITSFDLELLN
jgi:hypothetical protein